MKSAHPSRRNAQDSYEKTILRIFLYDRFLKLQNNLLDQNSRLAARFLMRTASKLCWIVIYAYSMADKRHLYYQGGVNVPSSSINIPVTSSSQTGRCSTPFGTTHISPALISTILSLNPSFILPSIMKNTS